MIDVFCNVIDNFGDAGFSLRLSRTLTDSGEKVRLYCNNIETLNTIISKQDLKNPLLTIKTWPDAQEYAPAQTVIEAFSCRLSDPLNQLLKAKHSLVIELDYLTAEKFAEDCHGLSSSSDGLNSYFFFPGFTKKTGGLIFEEDFKKRVLAQNSLNRPDGDALKATLFSYENPKIKEILTNLNQSNVSVELTVFAGKPLENINHQYPDIDLRIGQSKKLGNITLKATAMTDQNGYDELLLNSDFNMIRGEESAVRGMLCGKPFVWHIYPQDEDAHIVKLNALFDRMHDELPASMHQDIETIRHLNLEYNGVNTNFQLPSINSFIKTWHEVTKAWAEHLFSLGSLTLNLKQFIESKSKLPKS